MRRKQRGFSMMAVLGIAFLVIVGALLAMKIAPAYFEYGAVKKAVRAIATEGQGGATTVGEVRRSFDRRAQIDDVTVITGNDLEITKEGGEVVVSFAYPKKIALFSNISLLIEFSGSSNK